MTNTGPEIGAQDMSEIDDIKAVYERYRHVDSVLRRCAESDDPIYKTAAELWTVIANYSEVQEGGGTQ